MENPEFYKQKSPSPQVILNGFLYVSGKVLDRYGDFNFMSKREIYEAKAEELVLPLVEANNFELVDVEYVKEAGTWYLRIYINKEGGININDCELVSRAFSEILDKEDPIEDAYILEVSSPGLGRPLKKDKDFQRNLGEEVEVRTYKPINKQKEFVGLLDAWDKETVTLQLESGEMMNIARADIALIRQYIEF